MVDWMSIGKSVLAATYSGLFYVILFLIGAAIVAYFAYRSSFTIKFRIRTKTNTFDRVRDTVAKIVKDKKDGIEKVQVYNYKKKFLPMPPSAAISLDYRGRYCVEAEIEDDGTVRYIVKKSHPPLYEPFDTNDQLFYINELRNAELRKKTSMTDMILKIAPIAAVLIIFIITLVYWGDIMEPAIKQGQLNRDMIGMQREIVDDLKEIIKAEQIIRSREVEIGPNEQGQITEDEGG